MRRKHTSVASQDRIAAITIPVGQIRTLIVRYNASNIFRNF